MGAGIAQVAAQNGHRTFIYDSNPDQLHKAKAGLRKGLDKLVDKGKISSLQREEITANMLFADKLETLSGCGLVIEAIVEIKDVKRKLFTALEAIVSADCIIASNTSSLSIASLASAIKSPERFIGIHFFNPATIMPLVEIIPGLATNPGLVETSQKLISSWGKSVVIAKDTPGFIVNRVARSFYGESIRIAEEQIADYATIDWAMKTIGGFKMGPFELMDFIGNDINFQVTNSVWTQFFFESRFKPSITQQRLFEAGYFGVKAGKGYYSYAEGQTKPLPTENAELGKTIFNRVIAMLINEAVDTLYLGIASKEDIDTAMQKGVNYPKGLLKWADELGVQHILNTLNKLFEDYGEDRYRPCILLKQMARQERKFYS